MKQITVLGSEGMAGHMVYEYLLSLNKYDVRGISKKEFDIEDDLPRLIDLLETTKPDVIINCIGILIKASQDNPVRAIFINSMFPHVLSNLPSRIIHLSTDCVFNGHKGRYAETDLPTERSWYGRTKALGELSNDKDLTLRTSIIGPELKENGTGLLNWVTHQTGEVKGFSNVMWNGITTLELAKQIDKIIDTTLTGIYHLVPDDGVSISKENLLKLIQEIFKIEDLTIVPDGSILCDKTLANNRTSEYVPGILGYGHQLTELYSWVNKK